MRGLSDISSHVAASDLYSIEFTTQGIHRCMSIRFWKEDILARVELHRHHQEEIYPDCYLAAISYLLSFMPPYLVWSAFPDVLPRSSVLYTRVVFSKMGYNTPLDLNPFHSQNLCTRMFCRPSTSSGVSTCSRSSRKWSSSCEGVRVSRRPISARNFAMYVFLAYFLP